MRHNFSTEIRGIAQSPKEIIYSSFASILAISILISPRFSFSSTGQSVDLRLQDFIVCLSLILFLSTTFRSTMFRLNLDLFFLPAIFSVGASLIIAITLFSNTGHSILRIAGYGIRPIETIYIALLLASLLIITDDSFAHWLYKLVKFVLIANFCWLIIQKIFSFSSTFFIFLNYEEAISYGPKLIGEESVFGAGQLLIFMGCIGLAEISILNKKVSGGLLLIASLAGELLVDSRSSLIGLAIISLITLISQKGRPLTFSAAKTIGLVTLITLTSPIWLPLLSGRLSIDRLSYSLDFRFEFIWGRVISSIVQNPILPVGPGGFGSNLPTEAHNLTLRSIAEWGIPVGLIYLILIFATFIIAFKKFRQNSNTTRSRLFSLIYIYFFINVMFAGFAQDSLSAVTPSHLWALSLALFLGTNFRLINKPAIKSLHPDL